MTDTLLALSTDHCRITPLFADDARALAIATTPSCFDQSAKVGISGRGAGWKSIGGLSTGWRAMK